MPWIGIVSYVLAALAYGAVAAMLLVSHPGGWAATTLATATVVSTAWGAGLALLLINGIPAVVPIVALDVIHVLAWVACMHSWLGPAAPGSLWSARNLLTAGASALGALAIGGALAATPASDFDSSIFLALLGAALCGLLMVEQLFRNARDDQRAGLVYLSAAVGGIFVVDLVAFAQVSLLGGVMPVVWQGRGAVNALLAPLLLIAINRQRSWGRELFVSRQITFYTASLVSVGGYLLVMGVIAYIIRAAGGQWGVLLQSLFLLLALVVLIVTLFSTSIRARAKVFLVKHFYRNKYDYRHEWLRLTGSLGRGGDLRQVVSSGLDGIAGIVSSDNGALWLTKNGQLYERVAVLGQQAVGESIYADDHPLVRFLAAKGWVVDSDEYVREPDRYGSAFGAPQERVLPSNAITVPLDCQGKLQGFVILRSRPMASLNFEDHDILKTAGRQVAVVLAQALAQESLSETRQFEAVNKLVTFLMHDLKNLIAQQELVVANAQRFRHRPEFIDDAIATVRSGVERMKKVMDQLQRAGQHEVSASRVDVAKVLMEVRSHCADREPVPSMKVPEAGCWVTMDRERLASVLTHLIRNAQDATAADGRVSVELGGGVRGISITVADTGRGMAPEFVRDRLFRPFDSTKGAQGMGIGAYQVRDIVRSAGGDVEVQSEEGVGTVFRVWLPAADTASTARPAA